MIRLSRVKKNIVKCHFLLIKEHSQEVIVKLNHMAFPFPLSTVRVKCANPMKTLTEFPVMNLKNAIRTKQELVTSGKTAEELPQALGEVLKIEGDRLNWLINAVELVGTKQEDLKRVVVYGLNEGEKAPAHATQKGDQYYLVEYYPSLNKNTGKGHPKSDHPGQENRKGKKRGRGGRRGDRGRDFQKNAGAEAGQNKEGEGGSDRPRFPRNDRPRFQRKPEQKPGAAPVITPVKPKEKTETPS
jgi:hypothetical protein